MKFTAGQKVVLLRYDRKVINSTVSKVGRRWISLDPVDSTEKFDGNTGRTDDKTGYASCVLTLEEWARRQRDERALVALRAVGVDVRSGVRASAAEIYDALKGLLSLPGEPLEDLK